MTEKNFEIPEFLEPELRFMEKRIDKSWKLANENKDQIHPSISFIDAMHLYDMGIDVTQLRPK